MTLSKLGLVQYKQFTKENWYIQDKDSHSVLVFGSRIQLSLNLRNLIQAYNFWLHIKPVTFYFLGDELK